MTWTHNFAADSFPTGSDAFQHKHLLGISSLQKWEILYILKEAEHWVALNRSGPAKHDGRLSGMTIINAFFENSTRTLLSFEIAGKRLGADVVNMHAAQSDAIVIRHASSGAVQLISGKVDCPVLNAGDGSHEHPTQALLDALTIMRRKGAVEGQIVVICGDVLHSRVARSNIFCLKSLGAEVRVVAPPALMPYGIAAFGAQTFSNFDDALPGADVVMMLRLQNERMQGDFIPSPREYYHLFGLDERRLALAKPDALVMHPGPMNRGVEIASNVADHIERSAITEQVEMGVAVRMACLDILTRKSRGVEGWA
jgi:aspartate carbamoyltransferase catalytic subunit